MKIFDQIIQESPLSEAHLQRLLRPIYGDYKRVNRKRKRFKAGKPLKNAPL